MFGGTGFGVGEEGVAGQGGCDAGDVVTPRSGSKGGSLSKRLFGHSTF